MKPRRPLAVTWLSVGVMGVAALNVMRAVWLWRRIPFLSTLPVSAPLAYLAAAALLWGVVWAVTGVGLWRLAPWGRRIALLGVLLYHAHTWVHRLLFEISDYARQVWPWHALVSLVSIAVTWFILSRPRVRRSFG